MTPLKRMESGYWAADVIFLSHVSTVTRLQRILRKHAEQRRATALLRAATAVDRLHNMGIKVQIIGSLQADSGRPTEACST